jgi:hypothetical protein
MTELPPQSADGSNPAPVAITGRPSGRPGATTVPGVVSPRRVPRFLPTIMLSIATFAVLFEFLSFQLTSGNDPALGSTTVAATKAEAKAARPVINRKIIKTKVVHHPPKPTISSTAVPVSSATTSSGSAPVPVSTSAPAPAPVAAPAPAPAPVTATS